MGVRKAAWIGENMANQKLSCEQAVRQFFGYLDRALGGESMESLESHLEACLDGGANDPVEVREVVPVALAGVGRVEIGLSPAPRCSLRVRANRA